MTTDALLPQVADLRHASREVVRELGMLEDTFAPASITHTQCHTLLEVERAGALTGGEVAERLRVDKSAVSRAVRGLLGRRLVSARTVASDRRHKRLSLTAAGRRIVDRIHSVANAQVDRALHLLSPTQRDTVVAGMGLYARALNRARIQARMVLRLITPDDDPAIAEIIRAVMTEFGCVGEGFAINDPEVHAMSEAYDLQATQLAEYYVVDDDGTVLGGGGFAPLAGGDPNTCELRKMYLLPASRGAGLGRKLLEHLLDRARAAGYRRCYLETMVTMHRARALYETFGFSPLARPCGDTGHFGCNAWYAMDLKAHTETSASSEHLADGRARDDTGR